MIINRNFNLDLVLDHGLPFTFSEFTDLEDGDMEVEDGLCFLNDFNRVAEALSNGDFGDILDNLDDFHNILTDAITPDTTGTTARFTNSELNTLPNGQQIISLLFADSEKQKWMVTNPGNPAENIVFTLTLDQGGFPTDFTLNPSISHN